MSGRKRGEVLTVLKGAFSNREDIFTNILDDIESGLVTLKEIELNGSDYSKLNNQKKKIKKELQRVDKEIQKLENALKNSSSDWYLDDEFEQAQELLNEYKIIKSNLLSLLEQIDSATIRHQKNNEKKARSAIDGIDKMLNVEYLDILTNEKKSIFEWSKIYLKDDNSSLKKDLELLKSKIKSGDFKYVIDNSSKIYERAKEFRENIDELSVQLLETREIAESFKHSIDRGYSPYIDLLDGDISKGLVVKTKKDDFFVEIPLGSKEDEIILNMPNDGSCKDSAKSIKDALKKIGINFDITYWGDIDSGLKKQVKERKKQR